jgi:uncharacterized membrane protein
VRFLKLSLLLTLSASVSTTAALGAARFARFGVAGATSTQATGVNLSGTVVGFYFDSQYDSHGFLRDASGTITTFNVPGASEGDHQGTYAWAINDAGEIAGTYSTASSSFHGFLRNTSGDFTTFDVPGETMPGYGFAPQGINDAGQVAGVSAGATFDGFIMQGDGTLAIFTPGGGDTAYIAINSLGEVAGTYSDTTYRAYHGFFRDTSGNVTIFDVPGAITTKPGYGTWASSLNDSGVIAGFWVDTSFIGHGYLRAPVGTIQSYDVPGATTFGGGAYINDSAVVAGSFVNSNSAIQGFMRNRAGSITPFDVPDSNPREGAISTGINGKGQVCGFFEGPKGVQYGFLRTP